MRVKKPRGRRRRKRARRDRQDQGYGKKGRDAPLELFLHIVLPSVLYSLKINIHYFYIKINKKIKTP
jgi:hypothetical protein